MCSKKHRAKRNRDEFVLACQEAKLKTHDFVIAAFKAAGRYKSESQKLLAQHRARHYEEVIASRLPLEYIEPEIIKYIERVLSDKKRPGQGRSRHKQEFFRASMMH